MDDKAFAKLFQRLSELGFDRDGAGNGIMLPGNEELARATGLPGHWSNHKDYTKFIKEKVIALNSEWKEGMDDMQLILEIKEIQMSAKSDIEGGKFEISPNCRLM